MHDYTDPSYAYYREHRSAEAKKVTVIGSVVNIILAAAKFAAGVVGGSTAMIADAFHSLSDLVTDVMVYVSVHIAAQEADEEHPYGHGRAETIGAAFTGAALVLIGVFIVFGVVEDLIKGSLPTPTWPAIAGAVVSIFTKEVLYHYTDSVGRKSGNRAVIANAWHHRTDSISSVAALIGIAGAMMGFPLLDPLAAILVVYMITKIGGEIIWHALQELMDVSVSPERLKNIGGVISRTIGVVSYHELKTRNLGGDMFVDVHIQVRPNISVSEAHNIAETVRYNLKGKSGAADALVHIDAEEDLNYRIIKTDRRQIERNVSDTALAIGGVTGVSDIIIHYLGGETIVEFNVDIDDHITIGGAREMVSMLQKKLLEDGGLKGAVIRCRLTANPLTDDPAASEADTGSA